jgi:glycine/D-amino acid oxidase-like deaminating enzyme
LIFIQHDKRATQATLAILRWSSLLPLGESRLDEPMNNDLVRGPSATEIRDLRTGIPVWASYQFSAVPTETLSSSLKTDVVVIGAGITGALIAEAVTAIGLSTVVLDRRAPGQGSTAASTALLQFEVDTPLMVLTQQIGIERARRVWHRSFRTVEDLRRLVQQLGIACDFRSRNALYLAGTRLGPLELAEEGRQRREIGLPSEFLGRSDLHDLTGMIREAALLSRGVADVNPLLLTDGLLRCAKARGSRLFTPAQLAEVSPSTRKVSMVTLDDIELEAKALIFATGYELAKGVPSAGHRRSSTWAFATKPQPARIWSSGELIWEASDPYLYMRTTTDGRVLAGGEDEDFDNETARDALLPAKIKLLQKKVEQLIPRLDVDIDFAWTGTFGHNDTGLPTFGPVPDMPNCYAVLGYGGNGLTFSMVAAQVIVGALSGNTAPDSELFNFSH